MTHTHTQKDTCPQRFYWRGCENKPRVLKLRELKTFQPFSNVSWIVVFFLRLKGNDMFVPAAGENANIYFPSATFYVSPLPLYLSLPSWTYMRIFLSRHSRVIPTSKIPKAKSFVPFRRYSRSFFDFSYFSFSFSNSTNVRVLFFNFFLFSFCSHGLTCHWGVQQSEGKKVNTSSIFQDVIRVCKILLRYVKLNPLICSLGPLSVRYDTYFNPFFHDYVRRNLNEIRWLVMFSMSFRT